MAQMNWHSCKCRFKVMPFEKADHDTQKRLSLVIPHLRNVRNYDSNGGRRRTSSLVRGLKR